MAALMRVPNWSKTSLGPLRNWSPALRTVTGLLLANQTPMLLAWGPEAILIYNNACIPLLASKHPAALGQPAAQSLDDGMGRLIHTAMHEARCTYDEDLFLELQRDGFLQETHWTVACSPVPDESTANGIGGVLVTFTETTAQKLAQRRNTLLYDLVLGEHKNAREACLDAAAILSRYPYDLPFALIYLLDGEGTIARLAAGVGI